MFRLEHLEQRQELEETSWPTVAQDDRNGIGFAREECHEMDGELLAGIILDFRQESRDGIDPLLLRRPSRPSA